MRQVTLQGRELKDVPDDELQSTFQDIMALYEAFYVVTIAYGDDVAQVMAELGRRGISLPPWLRPNPYEGKIRVGA